jgi:hypothetical protein
MMSIHSLLSLLTSELVYRICIMCTHSLLSLLTSGLRYRICIMCTHSLPGVIAVCMYVCTVSDRKGLGKPACQKEWKKYKEEDK